MDCRSDLSSRKIWDEQYWDGVEAVEAWYEEAVGGSYWTADTNEVEEDRAPHFVQKAVDLHLAVVDTICKINCPIQADNVRKYVVQNEKQVDLANWNWRTCIFIEDIKQRLNVSGPRWDKPRHELELAYMLLCPWPTIGRLEPRGEHHLIQDIWKRGDHVFETANETPTSLLQRDIDALRAIRGQSLFAEALLKTISMSTNPPLNIEQKIQAATEGERTLTTLRDMVLDATSGPDPTIADRNGPTTDTTGEPTLRGAAGIYAFLLASGSTQ